METQIVQHLRPSYHQDTEPQASSSLLPIKGNVLTGEVDRLTTKPIEREAAFKIEQSLRQLAEAIGSAIHTDQHPAVCKRCYDEVHYQHRDLAVTSGPLKHERSPSKPKGTLNGAITSFLQMNYTLWASLLEKHVRDTYDPEADKNIAYRDAEGYYAEELSVSPLTTEGNLTSSALREVRALRSLLDTYLDINMSPNDRMKLYHEKLDCQTVHLQNTPNEPELVGQLGVFAKKTLSAGEVLGMYTGFLLTHEQDLQFLPAMHTIGVKHNEENIPEPQRFSMIDGRGILSRMNTALQRDREGKPIAVAKKACNVAHNEIRIRIKMKNAPSTSVFVPYYVTTKRVKKGAELRVDYGYDSDVFNKRFVEPYLKEHPEINKTGVSTSSSSSLKKGKKH